MKSIKCIVVCLNSNGEADYRPFFVNCTKEQYEAGEHYDAAKDEAAERGYSEPMIVADETDALFRIISGIDWNDQKEVESIYI